VVAPERRQLGGERYAREDLRLRVVDAFYASSHDVKCLLRMKALGPIQHLQELLSCLGRGTELRNKQFLYIVRSGIEHTRGALMRGPSVEIQRLIV
jgi:hypothetical protein